MDESGLTQRREGDDDIAGLTTCLRGQEPLKILLTRVFYLFVCLFVCLFSLWLNLNIFFS